MLVSILLKYLFLTQLFQCRMHWFAATPICTLYSIENIHILPQMLCIFCVWDTLSRCPLWILFFRNRRKRCETCMPLCACLRRGTSVPASRGVWGCVGWILHSAAQATALKTSGCSLSLVPGALRRQKTLPYSHLWRYTCAFYSFSSAIILLSSRKRKMQVNIPAATAEVRAWCQIKTSTSCFLRPPPFAFRKRIWVSAGSHVQRIIQLGIIFPYITLPYTNINCLE